MSATEKHSKGYQDRRKIIATTIASPLSSLIAKFVTYPIDTIKTRIQANRSGLHHIKDYNFGHSIKLAKQIYQQQGVRGYFPGVTIAAFGSIIAFSVYLTVYQKSKLFLSRYEVFKNYPFLSHMASGFFAQLFSCLFWLPIDIIKERMQVQTEVKLYHYASPTDAVKKIHRSQGLIGLYRALGATLVFFGPMSAIFFASYEQLKRWVVKDPKNQTIQQSIICSAGAGAISGYLTTPLELVKMRMQIQRADRALKGGVAFEQTLYGYKNIFHGLYLLTKNEGFFALFKGGGIRILFAVPLQTITFTLSEQFRQIALRSKIPEYFM